MSETAGEKTQEPTAKRRKDAADKGDVLRSRELATALVMIAGCAAIALVGPALVDALKAVMRDSLQFGRAELVADKTYRLSHLLRGGSGSELEAAFTKPAGSRFVLLDTAVQPLVRGVEALGRPAVWRIAAAGRDHADPFAVELAAEPSARALLPLAPVHLRARRTPAGVVIRWTRRTRVGGDSWEAGEVPLGEEREAYRVDILAGAAVVRSAEVAAPNYFYPAGDEQVDFGGVQHRISVRVRQISGAVGAGSAAQGDLDV